jgi:hypothetical protein
VFVGLDLFLGSLDDAGISLYHFSGSLDDVRIYNKALSAGEVWAIYSEVVDTNSTITKRSWNWGWFD